MKKKYLIFLPLLLIESTQLKANDINLKHFKIKEYNLCIPYKNVPRELSHFEWIFHLTGLDISNSADILIDIPFSGVSAEIDGYIRYDNLGVENNITGIISHLSAQERQNARVNSGLSSVWKKTGAYRTRHVEYDQLTGLYEVFTSSNEESKKNWDLLNLYPNEKLPVPDIFEFWVASCQEGFEKKNKQGPAICNMAFMVLPNLSVNISVSGDNIHLHKEIKFFMKKIIKKWNESCEK